MQEEKVFFRSGTLKIEGLYKNNQGLDGVVIAHPHPQMGGNMHNNVVDSLVSVFENQRFSTLRFNFRGVGLSEGIYDNGRGETEDVIAAQEFLFKKGKRNVVLAGYSFGAVVSMAVFARFDCSKDIILIAPPLNNVHSNFSNSDGRSGLIICGDQDQFCQIMNLKNWAERINFQFKIIEGADHFFMGMEGAIINHICNYLSGILIQ